MYRTSILFVILTMLIALSSCSKDIEYADIAGKWELVKLYPEKKIDKEKDNVYTIEFKTDNSVIVRLDVNSCWSIYKLENNNTISFENFRCTEVCCDTDYAVELLNIITASNEITIGFGRLSLEGEKGKAKFKRIK